MKFLMCPPTHYQILYKINPWMEPKNKVNVERAHAQWQGLYLTLQSLGAQIQTITPEPGCPDMVFTANAGVVQGRTFIPSRFRYSERRIEEKHFRRYFRKLGYKIEDAAGDSYFEGEGDLLPYQDILFGGLRFRSESSAHERVAAKFKKRFIGLELTQPRFYHLDTCFFPLDARCVVYYPAAFDHAGRQVLRQHIENLIPVSAADARLFACNAIRLGKAVVVNRASGAFKKALAREGYEVLETPTSEFIKAGGSVKCLTLSLPASRPA